MNILAYFELKSKKNKIIIASNTFVNKNAKISITIKYYYKKPNPLPRCQNSSHNCQTSLLQTCQSPSTWVTRRLRSTLMHKLTPSMVNIPITVVREFEDKYCEVDYSSTPDSVLQKSLDEMRIVLKEFNVLLNKMMDKNY